MFLQRHRFPGRAVADRDADLSAGVSRRGGRLHDHPARRASGPDRRTHAALFGDKLVFAYSIYGLFLGYLYFSIPRVILTIMAAVQKLDAGLEEAARSLGAGPWARASRRRAAGAGARLHRLGRHRLCDRDGRVRHRVHAGDRHRRAADADLHRVHAVGEFRDVGGAVGRARARRPGPFSRSPAAFSGSTVAAAG